MPGAVRGEDALLLEGERREGRQAAGPPGRECPPDRRIQVAAHLGVDEDGRGEVEDAAGDRVHVERPGAQLRVVAACRVQGLDRRRVPGRRDGDGGLAAQVRAAHRLRQAGDGALAGQARPATLSDLEVLRGQPGPPRRQVRLEGAQRVVELPDEQVVRGPGTLVTPLPGGLFPLLRGSGPACVGTEARDVDLRQRHPCTQVAQPGPGDPERQAFDVVLRVGRGPRLPRGVRHEALPGQEGERAGRDRGRRYGEHLLRAVRVQRRRLRVGHVHIGGGQVIEARPEQAEVEVTEVEVEVVEVDAVPCGEVEVAEAAGVEHRFVRCRHVDVRHVGVGARLGDRGRGRGRFGVGAVVRVGAGVRGRRRPALSQAEPGAERVGQLHGGHRGGPGTGPGTQQVAGDPADRVAEVLTGVAGVGEDRVRLRREHQGDGGGPGAVCPAPARVLGGR